MYSGELVRQWYAIAKGETIEHSSLFFQFIAAWVAFNAIYTHIFTREHEYDDDRKKLEYFADHEDAKLLHRHMMVADHEYIQAVRDLKQQGVGYVDRERHPRTQSLDDAYNLSDVLNCVYQIRCNLFHGGKTLKRGRNARLVKAGHTIVAKLIEPYVREGL